MKLKQKITITKKTIHTVNEIVNDLVFAAEVELDLILLESPEVDILFKDIAEKLTEEMCIKYLKELDEIDEEHEEDRNNVSYHIAGELMVKIGFTEDVLKKYSL